MNMVMALATPLTMVTRTQKPTSRVRRQRSGKVWDGDTCIPTFYGAAGHGNTRLAPPGRPGSSLPTRDSSLRPGHGSLAHGADGGRTGSWRHPEPELAMQTPSTRRHDLDWIRVCAFGLLILYHVRSEEHTSELQSLMRISNAV